VWLLVCERRERCDVRGLEGQEVWRCWCGSLVGVWLLVVKGERCDVRGFGRVGGVGVGALVVGV